MAASGALADFARLPPKKKAAAFGVAGLVIALLYWQFLYKPLNNSVTQQDEANARTQRVQSYLDWFTTLARLNYSIGMNDTLNTASVKK